MDSDGDVCMDGSELPAVAVRTPPPLVSVIAPPDWSHPSNPSSKCHSTVGCQPKPADLIAGVTLNSAKILPWRAEFVTE